jgi:ATP/maltotriose-dependent transcriptional regulator MalT
LKCIGAKEGIVRALGLSGQVALLQGDAVKARSLLLESLMLSREIGYQDIAEVLIVLGRVAECLGDHAKARARYEECLSVAHEVGPSDLLPPYLEGWADLVATQGEQAGAARLWGLAETLREAMGAPISPVERASYERSVQALRTQLGEQAFATAWAQGRTMTLEQALTTQRQAVLPTPGERPSSLTTASPPPYPDGLTTREVEVLQVVAQGLTNEQVAERLVISSRTVDTHLTSIYSKIRVSSRAAATRYAIEHHLV